MDTNHIAVSIIFWAAFLGSIFGWFVCLVIGLASQAIHMYLEKRRQQAHEELNRRFREAVGDADSE